MTAAERTYSPTSLTARDPVLRDVRQPRHLPQGLDRGHQAQDPWILVGEGTPAFDDDRWELYDTTKDWSQTHDLSNDQPDKLPELQRLWLIEATKYNVLPLDDRVTERLTPDLAGRPTLIKGNSQLLFGGMGRLSESSVINIKAGPAGVGLRRPSSAGNDTAAAGRRASPIRHVTTAASTPPRFLADVAEALPLVGWLLSDDR